MTVGRSRGPDGAPAQAALSLPPTLFAMILMTAVAAMGLTRLIGSHMTRDPLGTASLLGLAALAGIPLALVLSALRDGSPGRIAFSVHPPLLLLRALAKGVFLATVLLFDTLPDALTFLEFSGYACAVAVSAVAFGARVPPRDAVALAACVLGTVTLIAPGFLAATLTIWQDLALLAAILALGLFVALTHRLAPEDGVATLLFWDSLVTLVVVGGLYATGHVAWDGAPLNQAAGVVLASVAAAAVWIKAYALAPVSRLTPFEYLALPLMLVVALLFGQSVPPLLLAGFGAVVPVCALLALREAWLVRQAGLHPWDRPRP